MPNTVYSYIRVFEGKYDSGFYTPLRYYNCITNIDVSMLMSICSFHTVIQIYIQFFFNKAKNTHSGDRHRSGVVSHYLNEIIVEQNT